MASGTSNDKLDACCLTEYRPLPGTPSGQIIKIAGIDTYYISGKDETSKGKVIVLLSDIFGKSSLFLLQSSVHVNTYLGLVKNPRIIADELSEKSGFDVYVPDYFNGDAIHSSFMKHFPEVPGEKTSIGKKVRCRY
jgi:dienelactone hydrolase